MASIKKIAAGIIILLVLSVIALGALALSDPIAGSSFDPDLAVQSQQPDIIASISEGYVNRLVQSEMEKSKPEDVENLRVSFRKNGTAEVLATIKIPLLITSVETQSIVGLNISMVDGILRFQPSDVRVGNLGVPSMAWKATVEPSVKKVEEAANLAAMNLTQQGYRITDVRVGDHYLTLIINELPQDLAGK
jgi:hydrogenase maturation factor HypE